MEAHPQLSAAAKSGPVYDAFLSYSHTDLKFAEWLEEQLESYRPPSNIPLLNKRLNIFRDESDVRAATDLTEELRKHIGSSRYLIIACSPDARKSEHVRKEIAEFIDAHGSANVLCVLCAGRPNQEVGVEDPAQDQAFPDVLLQPGREPLAADFRAQVLANSRTSREELLKIIAPLLGVQKNILAQRERERSKRRWKRITYASFVLLGLLLLGAFLIEFTPAGQLYQIRLSAHSYISKGGIDADARKTWALAEIDCGYDEDAERTLDGILNPVEKVEGLTQAAEEWIAVGRREEADHAIAAAGVANKEVQDLQGSINGDILIARAGYKIRGMDATEPMLYTAMRRSLRLPSAQEIMDRIITISGAFRAIGDSEEADDLLKDAPEFISVVKVDSDKSAESDTSVAMRDLALALAKLVRFEAAEATAEHIRDPFQKALALAGIAGALNRAGNKQEAISLLDQATRICARIADGYYSGRAVSEIAKQYTELGMFKDAARLAASIDDDFEKLAVVGALCRVGGGEEALTVVQNPAASRADDSIEAEAASAIARGGDFARAEQIARNHSDPDFKDLVMSEVAKAMAEKGKLAEAEVATTGITNPYRKASGMAAVSYAYAKSGNTHDFDRVVSLTENVAQQISDPSWKCAVFRTLARAALVQGKKKLAVFYISRAADAAVFMHDPRPRSDTVNGLVRLLIENGMLRGASRIANMQTEDSRKVESYGQAVSLWKTLGVTVGPRRIVLF
jgi:tetratricopeptide (TPR) repeat protein